MKPIELEDQSPSGGIHNSGLAQVRHVIKTALANSGQPRLDAGVAQRAAPTLTALAAAPAPFRAKSAAA